MIFEHARGVWARRGEYVMLWKNEDSDRPTLEVFATDTVTDTSKGVLHTFDRGVVKWNAQMLEGDDVCVAIHTVTASGKHRIHLWDVVSDVVRRGVVFDMGSPRDISTSDSNTNRVPSEVVVESAVSITSAEAVCKRIMEAVYPEFCISENHEWAVAFSCRIHGCVMCSMSSSFIVWRFLVPEDITFDPFRMRNQVMLDSHERLLLLGDAAILIASSTFVSQYSQQYERLEYLPKEESAIDASLASTFTHLPSEALAKVIITEGTGRNWVEHDGQWKKIQSIRDVAVSEAGDLVAMIVRLEKASAVVAGHAADLIRSHHRGHWPVFSFREDTDHGRVFLFVDDQGEDAMVLLDVESKKATFCNMRYGNCETIFELDILGTIQSVNQTQDRRRLVILVRTGVVIYNLCQRDVESRSRFTLGFGRIVNLKEIVKRCSDFRPSGRLGSGQRRVSEDGDVVLIGWDAKNERSVIANRYTGLRQRTSNIEAAGTYLSEFCALSRDGRKTLFIDIDAFSHGLLVLGIFEESVERVTQRVLLQSLPQSMSKEDQNTILNNVFYDLTPDGAKFFIARTPCRLTSASLDECIVKVSVLPSHADIVNYDRLIAQPTFDVNATPNELFERFGPSVFNFPHGGWISLFQEAIFRRNWDLVESIQGIAQRNDAMLSIQLHTPLIKKESSFLLKNLLTSESTNDIHKTLALIRSTTTPFNMAAEGMRLAFEMLSFKHPYILQEVLSDKRLRARVCELDVHVDYMNAELRRKAIHIDTADNFSEWTVVDDPATLGQIWREQNDSKIRQMEKTRNTSTVTAALIFIAIKDAAKVGMRGIIRLLLMQNAPAHVFKCDAVKWVVMFKWTTIWRKRSILQGLIYISFLAVYTLYAVLLGSSSELSKKQTEWKVGLTAVLFVIFMFGCRMLREEIMQAKTFAKEGLKQDKGWLWGLKYHFVSRWNCVDLFSCLMLIVVLPLLHSLAVFGIGFEEILSACVAIEAIVASLKMWYFAQPFRETGALVLMVNTIVRDSLAFLILTFLVLFGFALALHVLYRHVEVEGEMAGDVEGAFSTFKRSLVTLFFALLGTFEPEILWSAGKLTGLVMIIFSFFIVSETIVLLNLLIAIMGDTFDRVKGTEEDQLLMGRAFFIDSCEAALSESEIEALNKKIGMYVRVLMPLDEEAQKDSTYQWMGKIAVLEERFNAAIKETEKRLQESMEANERTASSQRTESAESNAARITELEAKMEHRMEQLNMHYSEMTEHRMEQLNMHYSEMTEHNSEVLKSLDAKFDKMISRLEPNRET